MSTKQKQTKKELKNIPNIRTENGELLKLRRADFPYSRNGIIAYCDYRIEYWKAKKIIMLAKSDPISKKKSKRDKLLKALKEIEVQIEAEQQTNS